MNRSHVTFALTACVAALSCFIGADAEAQSATQADQWHFAVGAAALTQPRYAGSGRQRTYVFPTATATYGRFVIGGLDGSGIPFGVGMTFVQGNHWKFGGAFGSDVVKQRKESNSPRLRGLGDVQPTVLGSLYASYDDTWFLVRGNVVTDLDERNSGTHSLANPESRRKNSEGTRLSLDILGRLSPMQGLTLTAGPGVIWADHRYQRTFFGVDADQSAASGLPAYSPGSGINTVRMTIGADYRLTPQWNIGAQLVAARLRGDAADSPVTEKRRQNRAGLIATYRF